METIKSKRDFEKVFRGGKRLNHPLVRLTVSPVEGDGVGRVAYVAAKKLGCAPHRNRCKRVLRAAAAEADFPPEGFDVILFSTPATYEATSHEVAAALAKLRKRINA